MDPAAESGNLYGQLRRPSLLMTYFHRTGWGGHGPLPRICYWISERGTLTPEMAEAGLQIYCLANRLLKLHEIKEMKLKLSVIVLKY